MQPEYRRHGSIVEARGKVTALTCAQNFHMIAVHVLSVQDLPDALLDALVQAVGPPAVEEAPVHCRPPPWEPTEGCGRGC